MESILHDFAKYVNIYIYIYILHNQIVIAENKMYTPEN